MDDLVVIILTLLIAGAGVIGQLKKKKQITGTGEEQKNKSDIWGLLREEFLPQEPKAEPEYTGVEQEEFEPFENEQGYKFEPKNEGGKLIENNLKTTPEPKIKEAKLKEEFSLRKAVIYSEILNRKYN